MADAFQEAVKRIQKGDEAGGRRLLQAFLAEHPQNAKAWLWLATVDVTDAERVEHLKRALSIEPNNPTARKALDNLSRKIAHASSTETWTPPAAVPAAAPRPAAVPRPAWKTPMRISDWILGIAGMIVLVGIGIGAFLVDRVYQATADAYLSEGRLAAADVVGKITYWRRGAVMYCKLTYRFKVDGVVYENEETENDLDVCAQMEATGKATVEYLMSNPGSNRMPWKYPEDYSPSIIGPVCGGASFLLAVFLLINMIVRARRGAGG
jgi:hypothetical protein